VFQGVEDLAGVRAAGQRRGERRRQRITDAHRAQQVQHLGRQPREDLPDQVVGDGAAVAGEVGEEPVGIVGLAQGQRRQPQPRGPALRLLDQQAQLVRAQQHVGRGEQLPRFGHGEPEGLGADLAHLGVQPHPAQREGRIAPPAEHEVQAR
jgi:hypothetical protein